MNKDINDFFKQVSNNEYYYDNPALHVCDSEDIYDVLELKIKEINLKYQKLREELESEKTILEKQKQIINQIIKMNYPLSYSNNDLYVYASNELFNVVINYLNDISNNKKYTNIEKYMMFNEIIPHIFKGEYLRDQEKYHLLINVLVNFRINVFDGSEFVSARIGELINEAAEINNIKQKNRHI